jgi:hypothetical protein
MPSTGVISAMPVEGIIDPACARTIRRSPKRSSPDGADNAADHSADRPSDHKARPGAESCANGIGLRTSRRSKQQEQRRSHQYNSAHELPPMIGVEVESVALQRPAKHARDFSLHCAVTATAPR